MTIHRSIRLISLSVALVGVMTCTSSIVAAPNSVYQPLGAPADPLVAARWNFYRDYAEATGLLKQIAAAHPKWCRLESLGQSYGGRELWVMTITNQADTSENEDSKPGFWIDGGIHANELQAVDVVLYTAWYLAETAERSEFTQRLLNERVIYLMPMMSPDSRDAHMYRPNSTNSPRGGQMPVDDDRDGLVDEDPSEDLDGDGSITQMRIRDPNGKYKVHPEYPNYMVRIEPGELASFTGERYTLLGSEGFDNDGDGRVNEDGDGYYDPNRDWAWQWQPGYMQRGAYRYPFSIKANRLVAEFITDHPNIAGGQSYHNTGGMILRGPGSNSDSWPRGDIAVFDRLAKRGEEMLPGYRYLNTAKGLYEVWGGEHDWLFAMRGIFAFTNELNTPFNLFRKKGDAGSWFGSALDRYRFDRLLLFGEGFVDWHEVDHPEYGRIEVGGQKKNWGRQPPSFMLEEECHRNMAFTLFHADQGPLVEIDRIEVEPLAGGLRQVTATLINRRLTPTRARHDVQNGITAPDRVELTGPTVVAALMSDSVVFDRPEEVTRDPAAIRLERLASQTPKYIRWLVTGNEQPTVTIRSVKGGTATKSAE
ncbi:MAG: M14 family metallopeptidase [Planctomycetota bacterium]